MKRRYVIGIDGSGVDEFIRGIDEYQRWLKAKCEELAKRLADLGAESAKITFETAEYIGDNDVTVTVENRGDGRYAVIANGEAALVIEFGSGITYGYGHPEANEHGMGPGTYPDAKGHWNDPKGWYLPKAKGGQHTYGNPPDMAMYGGVRAIEQDLAQIVREVFGS